MGGNITRVLGVFNVIGYEEMWEVTSHVMGIFNVIDCDEEMWEVASHESWGI